MGEDKPTDNQTRTFLMQRVDSEGLHTGEFDEIAIPAQFVNEQSEGRIRRVLHMPSRFFKELLKGMGAQ